MTIFCNSLQARKFFKICLLVKKKLRMSNSYVLEVPDVIRCLIPERIAVQYEQYCEEVGFTPFSKRTLLLAACSATVRKSLQGLDYLATDGASAFDRMISLLNQLKGLVEGTTVGKWHEMLKNSKRYLKADFKVRYCSKK